MDPVDQNHLDLQNRYKSQLYKVLVDIERRCMVKECRTVDKAETFALFAR